MTRAERVAVNRESVLEAARRVFLAQGYAGATLEAIADEAGFSKGVMYSQFDSKADLFFALLEARIQTRAAQNEAIAKAHPGRNTLVELIRAGEKDSRTERGWAQLLLEFRLHAARVPEVNERYAVLHARACAGVARVLKRAYAAEGMKPPAAPKHLAALVIACGAGITLENLAADVPSSVATAFIVRGLGATDIR
jgi:AcrR family transcriptional regulator